MREKINTFFRKGLLIAATLPMMLTIARADDACSYGICPPKTGIIRVDSITEPPVSDAMMPFVIVAFITGMLFIVTGQLLKLKLNESEAKLG